MPQVGNDVGDEGTDNEQKSEVAVSSRPFILRTEGQAKRSCLIFSYTR